MTSKTSLFNSGIYKATVRRFTWGAVLYAIVLFMITVVPIVFVVDPDAYLPTRNGISEILYDGFLQASLLISYIIPTVTALLVFRFVHSKKMSVFVHGLPVSRAANYISSLLAAFTLMLAPIVINGIILTALSVSVYGNCFSVASCFVWMGINALSIFLMFSVAAFSAFLTGNSFALIGINLLMHCISLIFAGVFSALSNLFLYGYHMTNDLLNTAIKWNFVSHTMNHVILLTQETPLPFNWKSTVIMVCIAVVLYIAAYLLYKNRRLETAEDVAAYKCLNPIFKYLLCAIVSLSTLALFGYSLREGSYVSIVIVVIVSAVVYFATEMVLKKSMKIWKSYKGYLAFMAIFIATICIFAFTTFFGYETRVPTSDKVKSVSIGENTGYGAQVENSDVINYAIDVHSQLVEKDNIYTVEPYSINNPHYIYMEYILTDGGKLVRKYPVTDEKFCEILDNLYSSNDYKEKNLEIFSVPEKDICGISLNYGPTKISDAAEVAEFLACLESDLYNLKYTQIRDHGQWSMTVGVDYYADTAESDFNNSNRLRSKHQRINASFTNTIAWLIAHGFKNELIGQPDLDLTVLTAEQYKQISYPYSEKEFYSYGEIVQVDTMEIPTIDSIPNAVRISDKDKITQMHDYVLTTPVPYAPDKEYAYYMCYINAENHVHTLSAFYEDSDVIKFVQ